MASRPKPPPHAPPSSGDGYMRPRTPTRGRTPVGGRPAAPIDPRPSTPARPMTPALAKALDRQSSVPLSADAFGFDAPAPSPPQPMPTSDGAAGAAAPAASASPYLPPSQPAAPYQALPTLDESPQGAIPPAQQHLDGAGTGAASASTAAANFATPTASMATLPAAPSAGVPAPAALLPAHSASAATSGTAPDSNLATIAPSGYHPALSLAGASSSMPSAGVAPRPGAGVTTPYELSAFGSPPTSTAATAYPAHPATASSSSGFAAGAGAGGASPALSGALGGVAITPEIYYRRQALAHAQTRAAPAAAPDYPTSGGGMSGLSTSPAVGTAFPYPEPLAMGGYFPDPSSASSSSAAAAAAAGAGAGGGGGRAEVLRVPGRCKQGLPC